jgi:hypothetical protein
MTLASEANWRRVMVAVAGIAVSGSAAALHIRDRRDVAPTLDAAPGNDPLFAPLGATLHHPWTVGDRAAYAAGLSKPR